MSPLFAQGTVTDNDIHFVRTASSFDTTPEADFTGVVANANTDHMFEHGWWYRTLVDGAEIPFGTPDSQSYAIPGQSTAIWLSLAGGLFAAEETIVVEDAGDIGNPADGGMVEIYLRVTNLSEDLPLNLQIFHMADVDVNGNASDSAALVSWVPERVMRLEDSGGTVGHYVADDFAAKYLVRPFGATSVRSELNDANIDEFNNTGLPFGPGDFTAGWQVPMSLAPSAHSYAGFRIHITAFTPLQCNDNDGIFCDGFDSGSTGTWPDVVP